MKYTVYYHKFPNGKMYFGQTCRDVKKRWRNGGKGYKGQTFMWNAIQKYGWYNIEHRIISIGLDKDEADFQEMFYISAYRTNEPEYGYNITSGGDGAVGIKFSDEAKKKISEANKGKHLSDEHKKKLSESKKGKHPSDEARKKMSEARCKWLENPENRMKCSFKGSKNGMYGVHRYGELAPGYGKHRKKTLEEKRKVGKKIQRLSDGKIYYTIKELCDELKILTLPGIIYRIKNNKLINGEIYKYI